MAAWGDADLNMHPGAGKTTLAGPAAHPETV